MKKHNVAFVGPKTIHHHFTKMDDAWDFQIPLPELEDLERELGLDETESNLSKNTSLIILFSRLFNDDQERFANLASFLAPYSVVCVLIPEQDIPRWKPKITEQMSFYQERRANADSSYHRQTPYYFVSYSNAQAEIWDSIFDYSRSELIAEDVRSAVKSMLPDTEIPEIEDYSDYEDQLSLDREIVIPDKLPNDKSTVIAVTSPKGGSGKSTITMLVSTFLAAESTKAAQNGLIAKPLKICVVDLDSRNGQLGFINARTGPSVVDIVASVEVGSPISPADVERGVYHSPTGLDFIFAAKRARNAREIPPNFYVELIGTLRQMYDIIVLDTSVDHTDPLLEQVAYPMSDHILLISDFGISSLFLVSRWLLEVTIRPDSPKNKIAIDKVKVVFNRSLKQAGLSQEKIEKATGDAEIIAVYPSCPELVVYCANTASLHKLLEYDHFYEVTKDIVSELFPDFVFSGKK